MTRILALPDWVYKSHVRADAIPLSRRTAARDAEDRVLWQDGEAAGFRLGTSAIAWTLGDLAGIALHSAVPAKGSGWLEIRLRWSTEPAGASLLIDEPWSEAAEERLAELGESIAHFLRLPFERHGAADA